uniref:Meiosis regulator and mRNA stability factor 1 n=1 Tax=Amazona collaria TaxID=241587 RepID=A0A8B9GLT5_9PSIT
MMEGNRTEDLCNRSFGWLRRQENDAKPWLWKLSDCFSAAEKSLPCSARTKDYMENKKAAIELKDASLPHNAGSKLFPAVPLPDVHPLQQQQIQLSPGPKVSCCAHGSDSSCTPQMRCVGGGNLIHPGTILDSKSTGTITCQVGSGFAYQSASTLKTPPARSIASEFPGMCVENSVSSCQHLSCCGKLHFQSCHGNVHKLHQYPALQSCTSSGYFPCSEFTSGAAGHLDEHIAQSELTSRVYANPLHLNMAPSVCLKGSHYCSDCLSKPTRNSLVDAAKIWPNIPPPNAQTAPVPIPICNGCGNKGTGNEKSLLLASSLGKSPQKYGSPEVAVTGQVLENLPPIGVFWDIENCSVPTGRSAIAVVQRIREKFFKGHREAEFICVCDISKENKEVIQELNNCQVTVAHINATAKNAADDKLRQSLRRFADTHTAPATVVLVSTDVNFALELSDLRHRHGFRIILVHKNQASEALLRHAHELVCFEEFISDLPPRLPLKVPELCHLESKPISRNMENQQEHLREQIPSPQSNSNAVTPVSLSTKKSGMGETSCKSSQKYTSASRSVTNSPVDKKDKDEAVFQVSYPSAFSKLTASRQLSPLLMSQSCWSSRGTDCPEPFANGADIQVSNIDYRLSRKELQQHLQEIFSRHGKVKSIELSPHTDYQLKAIVQMENLREAISAVNSLHRHQIGGKRIQVSLTTGAASKSLALLSSETISILQDAPACCLPVFKFTEIYEKKFGHKLVVSDLYKLTDTVAIRDQGNGRLVCLLPSSQARQSPLGSSQSHDGSSANCSPIIFEELEYHEPVCKQHCLNKDFIEREFDPDSYKIPFVILSLKTFAPQVHSLLQTHEGTVPLLSFPDCYMSEFSDLEMVSEGQGGVPLEHLITCVPGVNIATAQNGIKVIKWIHNKPPPPTTDPWLLRSKSPVGNPQLIQFSREVIDLLKSQPSCVIPVSKFIPTYHHHFAKQCRVSNYGFSKLMELLEAVPHVLQILGMGSKRLLTLTHRAQVKRFTQDLLKLLKSQASKQVIVREFLQAYHWCFSKDWDVTEYGVCELADIISEIPDTTICLSQQDNEMVICIPKRERTQEEIERTKWFAKEVVDLLRHQPHFRMPFNKFIPSYHHHFGRQCKLAYYGFTKLVELFEAIPDVLQILECGEEKILTLTEVEQVKAVSAQFVKLLRSQKDNCLMMSDVLTEYRKTFGYTLRLHDYDVSSVPALMQKLCHVVKVVDTESGKQIQLLNRKSLRTLTAQLLVLLMSWDGTSFLSVEQLKQHYETTQSTLLNPCEYGYMTLTELLKSLPYLVEVFTNGSEEEYVKLTNLYVFAKNVRSLLHTYHYQQIFLHEFPVAYSKYTGEVLQPKAYGCNNLEELLGAIPQVVWIKGHGHKRIVVLKNDMKTCFSSPSFTPADHVDDHGNQLADNNEYIMEMAGSTSPMEPHLGTPTSNQTEQELLCLTNTSPVDLLCEPVPSCLPSPQLRPDPVVLESADLIQFEERPASLSEIMILTEEEKQRIVTTAEDNLTPGSVVPNTTENALVPPCHSSETQQNKAVMDSPAKKQHKNKVKLAANFSLAPITKL